MKKRNLKTLLLNKKTVSSLAGTILGGDDGIYGPDVSVNHRCPSQPKTRCVCPPPEPTINSLLQSCHQWCDIE